MTVAFEQERLTRVRNDLADGSVLISGPNVAFRLIALKPGCTKLIEMALSIVSMLVGGGSITKFCSRPEAFLEVVRENAPHVVQLPTR